MLNVRLALTEAASFAGCASQLGKARNTRSLTLAAVLLCSMTPAKAEYRLHVGDVIEISVARLPELKQRVHVQLDGTISFPLLGTLPVENLSPAEVQAKAQTMLAAKVFRQRAPDGHENSVTIEPDEVTATVVEYRPIYVNGDVSKPGEQAYRPLMTVRQAITLSGKPGMTVVDASGEPLLTVGPVPPGSSAPPTVTVAAAVAGTTPEASTATGNTAGAATPSTGNTTPAAG